MCAPQVTDNPEMVWTQEWSEQQIASSGDDPHLQLLVDHVRRLVRERDDLSMVGFWLVVVTLLAGMD